MRSAIVCITLYKSFSSVSLISHFPTMATKGTANRRPRRGVGKPTEETARRRARMPGLETSIAAALRAYGASGRPVEREVERLALAVHCTLLCSGFVPVDLRPDDASRPGGGTAAAVEAAAAAEPSWREGSDCFVFRYAHGATQVLLKCVAAGADDRPALSCTAAVMEGGEGAHTLDLVASDYVARSSAEARADLAHGMDVGRLGERVEAALVKPLLRGTASAGGGASLRAAMATASSTSPAWGSSLRTFEGGSGGRYSEPDPFGRLVPPELGVGGADLWPGGTMVGPDGRNGGGGMLVGPDHPMFGLGRPPVPFPGQGGGVVPPGARFDPYGPPGVPGFEPDRFAGGPRRVDPRTGMPLPRHDPDAWHDLGPPPGNADDSMFS